MKLKVKLVDGPHGKAMLLHDEAGVALPNQVASEFTGSIDDLSRVKVEFIIDGDRIAISD